MQNKCQNTELLYLSPPGYLFHAIQSFGSRRDWKTVSIQFQAWESVFYVHFWPAIVGGLCHSSWTTHWRSTLFFFVWGTAGFAQQGRAEKCCVSFLLKENWVSWVYTRVPEDRHPFTQNQFWSPATSLDFITLRGRAHTLLGPKSHFGLQGDVFFPYWFPLLLFSSSLAPLLPPLPLWQCISLQFWVLDQVNSLRHLGI